MLAPSDFLTHAKWVTDPISNPNEMAFRSGVSRAYYSLFHEAKQMLKAKRGIVIGSFRSHKQVVNELFKINKHASRRYKGFLRDRVQADYNLSSNYFTRKNARYIVSQIDLFIKSLPSII